MGTEPIETCQSGHLLNQINLTMQILASRWRSDHLPTPVGWGEDTAESRQGLLDRLVLKGVGPLVGLQWPKQSLQGIASQGARGAGGGGGIWTTHTVD